MTRAAGGPRFWTVVRLLLAAARRRSLGRLRRASILARKRGTGRFTTGPTLGFLLALSVAVGTHAIAAFEYGRADVQAQTVQAEARGRVVVEEWFAGRVEENEKAAAQDPSRRPDIARAEAADIAIEAARLATGDQDEAAVAAKLRASLAHHPPALLARTSLWWQPGPLPDIVASVFFVWWALILICQGEAPDLDASRARNPMWEWLFSHPVAPGAVFLAEMLAPLAANPIYLAAPLYPAILYTMAYGWAAGIPAGIAVGIPLTVALACLGRALEIAVVLRLPPRPRGVVLGIMGWLGFTLALLVFIGSSGSGLLLTGSGRWLAAFADAPWPPVRALLGRTANGTYVLWHGLAYGWLLAAILMAGAAACAAASAAGGIAGRWPAARATARRAAPARSGADPLYRKELLWFRRDTRALVQAVLVPLTLAALQTMGLSSFVSSPAGTWNTVAGLSVTFGTYFLMTLGPKSLASEGQALWIAQTWPRSLESLLRAKAKFWSLLATAVVAVGLLYAAWRFPSGISGLAAIAVLWSVFARTLALKTVTLVTAPSSSGEPQPLPPGLRWGASLGTFTFAIGIFSRQWNLVAVGMVYALLTASAMWQNLRARLPYLADPWSEVPPTPPTLLHAMVAISGMVEGLAVLSVAAIAVAGRQHIASVNAGLYGLCAIIASVWVGIFLARRGVPQREIWLWRAGARTPRPFLSLPIGGQARVALLVLACAAAGAVLGLGAHAYLFLLHRWPDLAQTLGAGNPEVLASPKTRAAYLVMAVGFAPLAEEFLFRGLLYRALDREWGGWRAVAGAAAFFAIYHPAGSWAPVAALGMLNAVLFRRTGRLAPAVAAHMAYNAVVLAW